MKHILCYGDSNTHGYIPGGGRYDDDTRYTGILAKLLGSDYRIIEEGLNSRTSSFDDPFEPYKNGMDCLVPCLDSHKPLNLTILMLVSPIYLGDNMADSDFAASFPPSSIAISHELGGALEEVARQLDIPFLDAAKVTLPSKEDSLHLTKEGHLALAKALAKKVKEILE